MALSPASASASVNPNQAQPQDSLDAYNQFSMNYATRGNPNGPSVGALGPSYQDWTNAGSPTDYQGYVNYFNKPQNPSNPQVMQGTANPNPTYTANPTASQLDPSYGMFAIARPSPANYASDFGAPVQTGVVNYPISPSSGGLSSLLNSGTPTMATNPLSQIPVTPTTNSPATPNLGTTAGSQSGGSFTQGSALPNITTTQQQATAAPQFYTDYLNQLAQQGGQAAQNAQYVGAQPLQQQAFNQVAQNVGNYQPTLNSAINLASSVGGSNLAQAIGDLGQSNIAYNLAPQATAGLVGSGQFGSTRGATALGDVISNAELGITAQQQQALQQDYANKLAASGQLGNLASQQQSLGLGDVNALATLGGQQQTIAQNQQLFPMQQLTNESALLRGYTMPTSTSSSYTGPIPGAYAASPLQQIAGLGALAAGVSNTPLGSQLFGTPDTIDPKTGATIKGSSGLIGSGLSSLKTGLSDILGLGSSSTSNNNPVSTDNPSYITGADTGNMLQPNGDGTYTDLTTGQTVDSFGNAISFSGSDYAQSQ